MNFNKMYMKLFISFLLVAVGTLTVSGVYVPNSRETSEPPMDVVYDFDNPDPTEFVELYSEGDLTYYFRESRGTVAIMDERNGYMWKTGTDLEYAKDIDDECDDMLDIYEEQFLNVLLSTFDGFSSEVNPALTEVEVEGSNGELKVNSAGLADMNTLEDIRVMFSDVTIENGKTYQISFVANALEERSMSIVIDGFVDEMITIPTGGIDYVYSFTSAVATTTEDIYLYFGNTGTVAETTIYLDDLALNEFDGVEIIADTNQIARGDFDLLPEELVFGDDDLLAACRPKEVKLNTTYTGFANSIMTIEYYDTANNIKRVSSSSHANVDMDLKSTSSDNHWVFEVDFKQQDIEVVLHMYLDDLGLRFEVLDDDVTGDGIDRLAAIIIAPFMGASGGAYEEFSLEELDYADDEVFKYKVPGYALVPDGSGTLIRFNDNSVKLNDYDGAIYGENPGGANHYRTFGNQYVPFKTSSMPVFGIAHGNDQAAFVAFATEGDEYMQIVSMPEENLTYYNFTYPRFEYNLQYFQVYNKSGWGYLSLQEERNHFDIDIRYNFLSGDGSDSAEGFSADYVGMAQSYREYLLELGYLTVTDDTYSEIPLRLDFLMSDVESGITGFQNQVTTTTGGVDRILSDFIENNITNINSGLLGWQDGGISIGDPGDTDFTREIGSKGDFEDLIEKYQDLGIDLSFEQNYYNINEDMVNIRRNATTHTSSWYARQFTDEEPIFEFYYARPERSIEWLLDQTNEFNKLGVSSYSISGITNNLTSDFSNDITRADAKKLVVDGFSELDKERLVNAYQPNAYIWQYVDRYLQTPIYGTQFLIESDTVPFVQLVLQNTMELYGPYSNFSFYTDADILRMIDYNIYPNFVLTEEPAYLLSDTLSRNFYSTEYELYEELIVHVYEEVNGALATVINSSWVDRTVVENGIILNEYDNGISIVINYTDEEFVYEGITVLPESYQVIGG